MFAQSTENLYSERVLKAFFATPQARPQDLAAQIPGTALHFRALSNALRYVHHSLSYVLDALQRWDDHEWSAVQDTVARELSSCTMFLAGAMDGMVILDTTLLGRQPTASVSFERTALSTAGTQALQDRAKSLRSSATANQPLYADFWTLANFWKHYFPYQPRPSVFERQGGFRDFSVALGSGCNSGPIMRDLLVPTFNLACDIMSELSAVAGEPFTMEKIGVVY